VSSASPTGLRRLAAVAALAAYAAALVAVVAFLFGNLGALVVAWLLVIIGAVAAWFAVTRRGAVRIAASVVAVVAVIGIAWVLIADDAVAGLLLIVVLAVVATMLATFALGAHKRALSEARIPGVVGARPRHPVLLMNPRSGGGKAERFKLAEEAQRRGIEAVIMHSGDDFQGLARDAVARGADALGAAGGDGTQALVAEVAMEHDLPFVCVPAGTRNHFALDLGVDRDDCVGALDGFTEGVERRVDLARVNDRLFVNNVSLGVYAKIVQSDEYRDDKLGTVARMLPELLGPDCEPFDLEFDGPGGNTHESADLILVSNNVYNLDRIAGFGTRPRLDEAVLGVTVVEVRNAADLAELVALQTTGGVSRFRGWRQWTTPEFEVRSRVSVEAGVDGEGLQLDAPLRFTVMPGALRVRLAPHHPGLSPAAVKPALGRTTVARLVRLAVRGSVA
jgi:diacylglycerol kinase family enzyme